MYRSHPVLQHPKRNSPTLVGEGSKYPRLLLEDGARRPPSYLSLPVLLVFALFRLAEMVPQNQSGKAHHSRTVVSVPRPPIPKLFVSISLIWLLEDGARRPPSYYGLPRQSHEFFTFHLTMSPSYYD